MPEDAARAPFLERFGVRTFRRLSRGARALDAGDAVHVLNAAERAALRAVERGCIVRACLAGALSTVVAASAEVWAQDRFPGEEVGDKARFWAVVGVATVLGSVCEMLFLYWDGLRSVHRLAVVAGVDMFPADDAGGAFATALARAALELPNPVIDVFGVHPHAEAVKWRLVVASLVYKAKVSVTNLIVKTLVRRVLGRVLVRQWLAFVAVPVTAVWDGVVAWLVLREARIRAMGPSAVREMLDVVVPEESSPELRVAMLSAVGSSIIRTKDAHPNLVTLMSQLVDRLGFPQNERLDSTALFLARLAKLPAESQRACLRLLTVAAIADGRLENDERRLLAEAAVACGRAPDLQAAERLRRAFVSGRAIPAEVLVTTA